MSLGRLSLQQPPQPAQQSLQEAQPLRAAQILPSGRPSECPPRLASPCTSLDNHQGDDQIQNPQEREEPHLQGSRPKNNDIVVGQLAGSHGVRGDMKVRSFMDLPESLFALSPFLGQPGQPHMRLTWTSHRPTGDATIFIARTTSFCAPEPIALVRGQLLWVPRSALPELPQDEIYFADLVGQPLKDSSGQLLGEIIHVHDFGAGPILEVSYMDDKGIAQTQFVALSDVSSGPDQAVTLNQGVPFIP
jgi:16S rRNA processing protein RimM